MEEETDNEIRLNLTVIGDESIPEKRKTEKSQRRDPPTFNEKPAVNKEKKRTNNSNNNNTEFISSLFNNNPEIPRLNLGGEDGADSTLVKEDVFSEDKLFKDLVGILHPYIVKHLESMGMTKVTLVQSKAIPLILAGKDALIKSQTGSGKTLAYALPILQVLQEQKDPKITRTDGCYALIIVPTRELAVQSFECFQKLCKSFARIVPGVLLGGEKKKSEKARIRKGINILITTPGRLIDHIQHTEALKLDKIKFLVFDEADRILELGYERDVQTILNALNQQLLNDGATHRQTLLLSATLTTGIERLSEISLKRPVFVDVVNDIGSDEDELKKTAMPENLKQTFVVSPAKLRLVTLAGFLLWKCRYSKSRKILVFMATQDMVDFHSELFGRCLNDESEENKIELLKLHGNMNQKDRMDVFNIFRNSNSGVLLCTDVAARGLDLPRVDWILQYNPPISTSDYVHRVGRTARIGGKGSALIFMLPSEAQFLKELESQNLALLAELTVDRILEKIFRYSSPSLKTGKLPVTLEEAATNLQMKMENAIANDSGLHTLASQAYTSFIRSYASYPKEVRETFSFKALHLGHIAKSFGLRDAPTKITGIGKGGNWLQKQEKRKKNSEVKKEERVINAQKRRINQRSLIMSEYSSGFEGIELKGVKKIKKQDKFTKKE